MSENNNSGATGGIGVTGLLLVAFIVLKLCKVIDWPWLWVLSPLWISIALTIVIGLVFIITVIVKEKKRGRW